MTQSKNSKTIQMDDYVTGDTITVDVGDYTINLDNDAITTTYWAGDSITDVTLSDSNSGTFTISATDEISYDNISWNLTGEAQISPNEVEKMCKQYPGLEKVWRNFKSVYDMCKQDFEGKKKAGEIDDDIPF